MDLDSLIDQRIASRLSEHDTSVFVPEAGPPALREAIRQRLGWLDAPVTMVSRLGEINAVVEQAAADGLTHVYLLGMGGSSLCAEVLRGIRADRPTGVQLLVLDTTDERTIRQATDALVPGQTLFIVASKSGSTIEVTSLERHFWSVMTKAVGPRAGRHFVAITDPDTPLVTLAASRGYAHTLLNPADIGGRYSALSMFGLLPAALLGHNVEMMLSSARTMAQRCRQNTAENPGLGLGAFMASNAAAGRDKLTLLLPSSLLGLGAWIEQLVAESTGKDGRGVLPVVGEPRGRIADYGIDRAFVTVTAPEVPCDLTTARRLESAAQPVFRIEMSFSEIGAEFFRWEFATAVAGAALRVNPFDEPNVKDAKVRTQAQLDARRATGEFRLDPPFESSNAVLKREHRPARPLDSAERQHRYLAILDFLPGEPWHADYIARLRSTLRRRSGIAATHGVGPRYLHSTGQYHKGGPNTGFFVLLTADDTVATPIPETDYTFSMLKRAQALGDFEALAAAGRDVVHYHVAGADADITPEVEKIVRGLRGSAARRLGR
jgi:glucose-6-phosphate isomerase